MQLAKAKSLDKIEDGRPIQSGAKRAPPYPETTLTQNALNQFIFRSWLGPLRVDIEPWKAIQKHCNSSEPLNLPVKNWTRMLKFI